MHVHLTFYPIFRVTNIFMDFKSRYFLFRFRYSARCRVGENRDLVRGGRSQNVQQTFASYSCLQSFQYKLFIFSSKLCVNTKQDSEYLLSRIVRTNKTNKRYKKSLRICFEGHFIIWQYIFWIISKIDKFFTVLNVFQYQIFYEHFY